MALIRNAAQPLWQAERWGFSGRAERHLRDIAHTSLLVFAMATVAAGILAGISLSSEFGIGMSASFIVVAILFPLLCGLLAKELWHAKKLKTQVKVQEVTLGLMGSRPNCGDNIPAGLLIVSPDLRVRFANQKYLENTFQEPEEVLGWKIQDVLPAEGLEDRARTVLDRPDPAASCCFNTLIRGGLFAERPVHITMTRIAPRHGEDRVLLVVEDLFPGCSPREGEPVEGYVC
jgi:PAS fold